MMYIRLLCANKTYFLQLIFKCTHYHVLLALRFVTLKLLLNWLNWIQTNMTRETTQLDRRMRQIPAKPMTVRQRIARNTLTSIIAKMMTTTVIISTSITAGGTRYGSLPCTSPSRPNNDNFIPTPTRALVAPHGECRWNNECIAEIFAKQ